MLPVAYRPSMTWSCLVEDLRVLVGDHSPARADVGREHLGGVERRAIDRPERGVGLVPGITQADVVRRLAAAEVGIETLGGELVEALDRLLQRFCGNIDLACQLADRGGALDGTLLDQFFGQRALLERVCARDVSAEIALVEDLPARHRLVGVHRLADFDIGVRLVAEPPAGSVDVDSPRPLPPRADGSGRGGLRRKPLGATRPRPVSRSSHRAASPSAALHRCRRGSRSTTSPRWAGRRCTDGACPHCD